MLYEVITDSFDIRVVRCLSSRIIGGEERRLAVLDKGDFFGEMAMLVV